MLDHPKFRDWETQMPRLAWALSLIRPQDPLRDRIIAAILSDRTEDFAFLELEFFAEALESKAKAERLMQKEPPPRNGERRSFSAYILRMVSRKDEVTRRRCFRVFFTTPQGWSGIFDTTNPLIVERISKIRDKKTPLVMVGEVVRRPYPFVVVLGSHTRIV